MRDLYLLDFGDPLEGETGSTTMNLPRYSPLLCASSYLAISTSCGKSVPIRRETHTVDKAAMILWERGLSYT